jgi:cytochrome c5
VSTHDQRFKDFFSIVIGALVAITIALIIIALMVGGRTQRASIREYPAYDAQVEQRLRPAGRVVVAGEETASDAETTAAAAPAPVTAPLSGPQVFNEACNACHGTGIGGAPKIADAAAWSGRIAQGIDTLYRHAIEGYQGAAGFMPAKGGNMNLSDQEVMSAVDYMVSQSR